MLQKLKQGEVRISLNVQEKTYLKNLLGTYLERNEKDALKNRIARLEYTFLESIHGKITNLRRCPHCKQWIPRSK